VSYLFIGLLGGLAAVERKGFLQGMLSRPLALAPAVGWALGDLEGGLMLAAPLELLWLGAVNLGAALPAHEALGSVSITGGAVLAGRILGTGVTPQVAVLAALFALPLSSLGRRAERATERFNEGLADRAEVAVVAGEPHLLRYNLLGLAMPFGISFALAPLGAAVAATAIPELLARAPRAATLEVGWVALTAFACASGAKALRSRAAAPLFAGTALLAVAVAAVVFGLGGEAG
jgi:PTS system mannose-specific IIC component